MFTIIIPTFDHQDTVVHALESVLQQNYQNFEIIVVGDGAPQRTALLMGEIARRDSRIRYIENPKGEGYGERYRHAAIEQSRGDYIAYLGDDDLWLANHLSTLRAHLDDFDFVHTIQPTIVEEEDILFHSGNLNDPLTRKRMLNERFNYFGPSVVAHRRDAYEKLPYGWRPKPEDLWSDLYMWRQWLNQPEIRFKTLFTVTALHLGSPHRHEMSVRERCLEMQDWLKKMEVEGFQEKLSGLLMESWCGRLNRSVNTAHLLPLLQNLFKSGQFAQVIKLCDILCEVNAHVSRPSILSLKIRARLKLKQWSEAQAEAESAMALFPDSPEFLNLKAELFLQQDKPEAALLLAKEVLSKSPDNLPGMIKMSHALEKLGKLESALETIALAEKRHPGIDAVVRRKARLLAKMTE